MSRIAIASKLTIKAAITVFFLGIPTVGVGRFVYYAVLGRLGEPNTIVFGRVAGGGDYLVAVVLYVICGAVGFAALRSVRASWREFHEPLPPQLAYPRPHPPGANWGAPPAVRVESQTDSIRELANDEIVVPATSSTHETSAGSDSQMASVFMSIGHAVMIICATLTAYMLFRGGSEAAPIGIFVGLGLLFYLFSFLIRILDRR